jgi:uncharacterized protein YdcH (DUF465 family)
MLGEDHSLIKEFPEHAEKINALTKSNPDFSDQCDKYNALDRQIRELEVGGAPIGDTEMRDLKHERRMLKDSLYKQLLAN